jgi:hypothetical protein
MLYSLFLLAGIPLLAVGLYAVGQGAITLTWPRTQATVIEAHVDRRQQQETVPGTDKYRGGRIETREVVTFIVRYRYVVDGVDYQSGAVEPADFGLQTSYAARWLGSRYTPDQRVTIAYDPADPARAYLRPGPSTPALALAAAGAVLLAAGLWLRLRL